VDLLESRFI